MWIMQSKEVALSVLIRKMCLHFFSHARVGNELILNSYKVPYTKL